MQIGPLLQPLELRGTLKILLHHIQKPIVVLHRTPRILHQQRARFSQDPTHFPTQLAESARPIFIAASLLADR